MSSARSGPGRAARVTALAAALAGLALLAAPQLVRGPRFGRIVERLLPATRGQIRIGGGRWTWPAVWALWRGHPAPLVLEDVRITDPEGKEVLRAGRLAGEIEIGRGGSDIVIHHLEMTAAAWRFATMATSAEVGFLAALAPRPAGGSPATAAAGGRASIRIEEARLEGLDAELAFPDWGLRLDNVQAAGRLSYQQGGGRQSVAFEVRGADARGGGRLRILAASRPLELPFSRARLDRVASSGAGAAGAPDSIEIIARQVTTGRSSLSLRGTFTGVLGASRPARPPGVDLQIRLDAAADAVQEIAAQQGLGAEVGVGGSAASLTMTFAGPFESVLIGAEARGFALRRGPLEVHDVGFRLEAEAAAARLRVTGLTLASPAGGSLRLDADLGPTLARAALSFQDLRFPAAPRLPLYLRPLAAGTLRGTVKARAAPVTRDLWFDEVALTWIRPAGVSGPRLVRVRTGAGPAAPGGPALQIAGARVAGGVLQLRELTTPLLGGRLAASGRIALRDGARGDWLPSPVIDLTVRAERISVQRLIGTSLGAGTLSAGVRARGPLRDLDLRVAFPAGAGLRILGERFELPPAAALALDGRGLRIQEVRLRGAQGAELAAAGRIGMDGRLDLAVTVHEYPLRKLPGLEETDLPLAGRLSGSFRLGGDSQAPALSGRLSIEHASFRERPVGGGSLALTPGPRGSVQARGQLIDGVTIDGTLASQPAGLSGRGVIHLDRLPLGPFLPRLPGGVTAAGTVSGSAEIQLPAGGPFTAEARLRDLALTLVSPAAAGPNAASPASPVELRAEGEVALFLRGGPGAAIGIRPVRFVGSAGALELAADSAGGASRASVRGRLNLGALAPLLASRVGPLSGAVDLDLQASTAGADARPMLRGTATVAAPVWLGPRGGDDGSARIGAGTLEMDGDLLRLRAVEVGIGRAVRLTIGGERDHPGTLRLRGAGPRGFDVGAIDLPLRGDIHALATAAATVESARFALRLEGQPQKLRLSGEVELLAAHARSDAATAPAGPGASSSWLARPEIARMQLDVRVRARSGALIVEVPHAPDLHVNTDLRIRGTVRHPQPSGDIRGATVYSKLALLVHRLFH